MPDNISKLYQELKGTYELGSENDFRKYLSDGKKREALRKELEADYEVGDSASFTKYLGLDAQPQQQPQQTVPVQQQAKPQPAEPLQMPQGFGQLDISQANQMGMGRGPVSWDQPQQEPKEETNFDKAMRVAKGQGTEEENKQVQKRLQQRLDEIAYEQETGKRLRQTVLNTDFEAPTLSRDEYGNIRHDENGNPLIGNTTNQDRVNAHQQVMEEQAEWDALSDKEKRERMKQMQLQREMDEYEEPGFLGVTGKKLASGFINAGLGLLKTMEEMAGGMIVEDASSPTGYSRTTDFDPNANDAITSGLRNAGEYAERLSREGEPRKGASFTDLLMSGDIGGFLLKGWGTGMESAPMTLSAYNPYTMALNAISMAGNNYWQETMENPEIPGWKRASYAIGTAAIEQAVEKFADPVFKYIGGGGMGKKVAQEVTEEAEKTIAKRIISVLKDAGGEGAEEIISNFGNDALGSALDWFDGESDYGIVAQWKDLKKKNPNASITDFAMQKADETMNSFFGGALAGAYTSGGAQATVAGLQYALGNKVSAEEVTADPSRPVHPATLDIAQSFDRGFGLEKDEDKTAAADKYSAYRSRVEAAVGEEALNKIDADPMQALANIDQYGLDEEGQRILGEYIGAKAEYDGVQQRIIEDNRASRPSFVVNGNNIDEVDAAGNVVATHEYANEEERKTGMWELQAKRDYLDMQADINMMRINPKYDWDGFVEQYITGTGLMSREEFDELLNKDPLERDDNEQAFFDAFAKTLHDTLYDNTEVHEEQSAQDGAKLADEMSIDINNISDENAARAQQMMNELDAAKQALEDAFAKNEDLKQEVERMEQQGMPHQGIVGSLDSFRPDEVKAVADFYNAIAKSNSFINQMSQRIDEEAANSTKRHTLNGTINGVADLGNIYTISDGTNEYFLVSGNITTDPATGQITGSDSGLIIGMDLDGSMVSIGDASGYSLTPNVVSASQFKEQERIRLQEAWSAAIDPNGAAQAAAAQQAGQTFPGGEQNVPNEGTQGSQGGNNQGTQSGILDNAGGEVGAENGTGANNPPATAPVIPAQPAVSIESVTDKDGIKRYENGIAVDDAIADIVADGFDVNEVADASIAEAQQTIDKINGKATKTRKDLMEKKKAQDIIDYYNNVRARNAELNTPAESEENVNVQPEQPTITEKPVSSQSNSLTVEEQKQQRIAEAKAKYGELFDDDFTKANDVYELVSMWVGRKRNLAWDDVNGKRGLQKELGWTRKIGGDTKYIETLLAKKGEGMGVYEFAHMLWESPENDIMGEKRFSTEEIKEALLDLLKSAQSKSDVVDHALNTRIAQAETALQEQQRRAEEEAQNPVENEIILTEEDIARMESNLPFAQSTDEEIPDSPITQLMKAVEELRQQEGMPEIKLVNTDRMSNDEWYDIASAMYGGAFVSQEEIETAQQNVLENGVFYNEETGVITVYSDSQTAEDVINKVNYVYEEIIRSDSVSEEGRDKGGDTIVSGVSQEAQSGEVSEAPAAEGANGTEGQGSPESVEKKSPIQGLAGYTEEDVKDLVRQHFKNLIGSDALIVDIKVIGSRANGTANEDSDLDVLLEFEGSMSEDGLFNILNDEDDKLYIEGIPVDINPITKGKSGTIAEFLERNKNYQKEEPAKTQQPQQDDYLKPRSPEEQAIIDDVVNQLQQEIEDATSDLAKARSDYEKARAKEGDRATDMFANDETFAEPDAIFSQEEMGLDTSAEGVERRTRAEQEKVQELSNKLRKLQSPEERNSRVRGALDNHRRQTSIDDTEKQIDERHKREYDEYIKPLLIMSDEELQQMAKRKEDAVGGDMKQLEGDLEYSAIQNVLLQREYDRQHKDVKNFIENTIDDDDVTFVDKLTLTEFDKLQSLINEYGVDDAEGKIEAYVKQLRKKYPAEENQRQQQRKGGYQVGDEFDIVDDSGKKKHAKVLRINNFGNVVLDVDGTTPTYNPQQLDEYRKRAEQNNSETSNPIEAIEQAAQQFREEQAEKNYGADNKLVTKDRYEELKKRMKEKMRGQMNLGVDPEILAIGTEMAVYHIEAGARKFADYATRMILDLGDAIRPYLKAFYEGARRLPEMVELSKEMDSVADVDAFDVLNYDKQPASTVNEHKQKNNEPKNVVSSQQETEETVERKAEDADKYRAFSQTVANDMLKAMETGEKPYKSIKDIRAKAKEVGLDVDDEGRTDILLQELVEDGLVSAARQYVNTYVLQQMLAGKNAAEVRQSRDLFNDIVKLYNLQPSITQRSSNRIKMGQFSTPLPMSFVADVFAYKEGMENVLEPTAGNGMMVFAIPESTVHANELDETRLDNLRAQKFKKVTDQDATQPFEGNEQYDAIVANPPFGSAPAKDYDGKEISGLAEQIALNALSKMKDDGRAAIIIGGNMEYGDNGAIKNDKPFFTYLYDHYNVKGVIDMDGSLFSKQGTTFKTRMILIDGRRSEEERAQVKVYPPVQKNAPKKAKTFEELFDIAEEIRNNNRKTNGNEVLRTQESGGLLDHNNASGEVQRNGRGEQSHADDGNGRDRRGSRSSNPDNTGNESGRKTGTSGFSGDLFGGLGLPEVSEQSPTSEGTRTPSNSRSSEGRGLDSDRGRGNGSNVGDSGRVQPERAGSLQDGRERNQGLTQQPKETPKSAIQQAPVQPVKPKVEEKRELDTEKLSYRPHNTAFSLESVAPAAMVEAMDDMLKKIEKEHGNIDAWVTSELGYDSIEEMHNALAAEQVDSVAMAIYQMQQGQAMIIGDQTGVGKGRQMASLIRWACRQGKKPVFVTYTSDLLSDLYRDLVDVGSGDLRPFIFNSDGAMEDANGNKVYTPLSSQAQKKVFETDKLPDGYDFAVLTYSQVSTGDSVSKEEAKDTAKKEGKRYQAKKPKKPRSDAKAVFLRSIAKDNYLLMDESHNAAGSSNTGAFFRSILKDAKAATFASATFAKRPDTMPLYAIRTAMSKAKVKADELIKIIENGGVTLQEIMSRALTQAGQMVRRERDMSDVKTDWKTVDDPNIVKTARENYDKTIEAFNAIIQFQENYVKPYLAQLSSDLADVASSAGMRRGTEKMGIENVPFASKAYNYTKQLMLALKVDAIVDEVVKEIEAGRHPVIALDNTMGSFLDDYNPGDKLDETTFAASLLRGLKSVLKYTIKDEDGKEQQSVLSPSQLGPEGVAAYEELENKIRESTSGIFISPLDAIIEKLNQKGYSVGELTGRDKYVELDENTGDYVVRKRTDKDKKKLARDFNNGSRDVLILNKSASTGISLHASEKFSDQRQRTMIIAQPLADINDYMQMIGRIDRTGQVARGYYINLGLPVPAEGRFLMMLSTKLKSLNANTTTSQENESNDVEAPDLLNKYGSRVVIEYLRDNPDIYVKMGEPLKRDREKVTVSRLDEYEAQEDDARKITGYVALLSTAEQDAFYNDVVRRYNELIQYLNDTGSNDLKISVLPLRARTIEKQVSSEGADPTGANPFAQDAFVEWVEMDVLKKPMKAAEIGKVIEQLNPEVDAPKVQAKTASQEKMLAGKLTPRVRQIIDTVEKETQAKLDKEEERYEAAKARADEDIAAKIDAISAKEKLTAEQKQEAIDKYIADRRQAVEESHNNMVNKIDANHDRLMKYLKMFKVGDSVLVPDDLTIDTFMGSSPGIFCGFKAKDEGITPSTTLAVFATLDGRRKIEVKLSDWQALARINNMTMQNLDAALNVTLSNWDSQIPSETRKHGYIMTGNILQAFADAGQDGRVPGQLVTYTDIDGEVHDGILMNQHWEPSQLKGSTVPIKNRMEEIKNLDNGDHIVSADGNVVIERYYRYYTITVPKSKKLGGQYYENDRLLDLVDGRNFYPSRGQLKGDVPAEDIEKVVNVLSDLGVQMKSDTQVHFDTETEMGQAQASGRFNNSQNTLSRNAETEESAEKDVPLERRTTKSYTDKDGNYHKGIEEELAELEADITRAGAEDATTDEGGSESGASAGSSNGEINKLRRKAAQLRAENARRKRERQKLRDKYNIDEKGNISLDDLSRMFNDLNSSKILGKLFDKVAKVLSNLGVEFRLSDNMDANVGGRATAFINVTFYNWDSQLRKLDNQEKARILLHEMIHNVASQILFRYERPELGKLTAKQERLAKQINDIFKAVEKFNPVRANGKQPYGMEDVHEMVSELANPEFRDILDSIPYGGTTVWQKIKNWFKRLIPGLSEDTALDSLSKALDDLLDTYDNREQRIYRQQRADWEKKIRDAGYYGNYVDFWESGLNQIGSPYIIEDADEIARLDNKPKEKGYRTVVQNPDGSFGSPMAGRLSGKKGQQSKPTSAYKMNQWERSEENPQLATDNGKINLIKPGGLGTVGSVDYNPYIHIRENKLNKQFKNAWERPDLVYIEVEYPASEMTSGYRAEKAAKTVGRHKWPGGDLILSRWDKPVRIVPWEEVADDWEKEFKNRGVEFDIVSPHLLPILADRGVKILPPHKNMGEECNKAYEAFKKEQEDIDPLTAIRRAARQFKRQLFEDSDPMEAIRRAADSFRRDSDVDSGTSPMDYSAKEVYNERLNRVETVFSEAYQDAMVSLKTAQNAIAGDKDIPDSQNAYIAENLMHGKNKNEMDLFNRMFRDPLINTINKIMNLTGMNWGDIDRYVYAKSGLERNREFFVRDWLESERNKVIHRYEDLNDAEQDIYDSMAATIEQMFDDGDIATEEEKNKKLAQALQKAHNKYVDNVEQRWLGVKHGAYNDLKDGIIGFDDYLIEMDNFIFNNIDADYIPSEHDYSGFRAMYGDENGKYDDTDIIAEVMIAEDQIESDNVDKLWEQINNATRYGLERYREAGMRTDEQIDRVEDMFHFYVPMRGFKAETGEDMYQYFTGKAKAKSYVGGLLKHAKGRGSEANYHISTIFAMTYKAISDCNQNLVNQKFYRLCQANPNDLVILSDSWAVYDDIEGVWKEVAPDIPEDASEDEVREITLAWEEEMKELAKDGKAKKIKGKEQFDYKPMDKRNQSEHIVDVRINGQPRKMIVTSNPRMAQALNGQLRFEHGKNVFSKWNAAIKNFMASVFTSYSPTFALRNMFRDWTHFRTMLGVREGHGYASQANKYYRQSLFKMVGLFKKYREGTLDESKEMERDFKDFMDNGGITGFVFMQKIDDIQKEMENIYKKQKAGKTIRLNNNLWEKILGAVEALNEGIENNARFATYRTSRHYAGRTKARSAYDAKEITVNFNKKGAGSKTAGFKSKSKAVEDAAKAFGVTSQIFGEGRIFFNATVQAIATTFKNFQNADGSLNKPYIAKWAAKYALPPFLFGLALPMINKALAAAFGGDDDDPYANLPEWTRRRNLCFYIGNDNFITIPIGQELAAFLTLGDIFAGNTYAPELKPVDRDFGDEMVDVLNTFSPVDISTKITKGGLMEDPISEVTGRTFSVLAPLVAIEQNLGWTGRPIYREDKFKNDQYTPEYQMVYSGTNPVLVNATKLLHELGGGDDITRGKFEVNPAIIQYLWEQYTGGPGKVFSNTISIGKDAKDILSGEESDFNMRKVEGLKAFVQQGDDRTAYYRTQAKYRKYKADAEKLHDAVSGYEKGAAENPEYLLKLEQLSKGEDFVRMQIIREADKQLNKINKAANKADGKERKDLRKMYNEQVKQVVDLLDQVGK